MLSNVPAPFMRDLAGLRAPRGNPNTSDNNDDQSIELGNQLILEMGCPAGSVGPQKPGDLMVTKTIEHLRLIRPDLLIGPGSALHFAQYAHLTVYPEFRKAWTGPTKTLAALEGAVASLRSDGDRARMQTAARETRTALEAQAQAVARLTEQMPEESILKLDITVGEESPPGLPPVMQIGLSAKWSLRTDRAQDCISQGSKLVALRRGRMPHFAVITIEPRPAMLKILADGSGSIDCIYHLDLPALERTINECASRRPYPAAWSPKVTFDRMLRQGRIRDYDDLLNEVRRTSVLAPSARAAVTAP